MEKFGSKKIKYFFGIEGIIYISFLGLDITGQSIVLSGILKFVGICLCAAFVWSFKNAVNKWKQRLFKYLYVFLIISDIFLLFTEEYIIGIITFIIVQLFYFYYLLEGNKEKLIRHSIWRLIGFLSVLFFIYLLRVSMDIVLLAAAFYFIQFLCNVILAIQTCKRDRICFLIGLLLFFLCDINVGLYQSTSYCSNEWIEKVTMLTGIFMWVFYLPGQVLLAYSSISEK